jgi:hypothetical protein
VVVGIDLTHKVVPSENGYKGVLKRRHPGLTKDGKPKESKVESYGICRAQVIGAKIPAWLGFVVATISENEGSLKLLKWLIKTYGKRFIDVIVGDAQYSRAEFINTAKDAGIDVFVRAKEQLNLFKGEIRLLTAQPKETFVLSKDDLPVRIREVRDLTTWSEVKTPLRLVEMQLGEGEPKYWLGTMPSGDLERVARILRPRWEYENNGHHNMKTHWGFKHMPVRDLPGLKAWWTIFAIAVSVFYTFQWACVWRLGKPRDENALLVVGRLIKAIEQAPLESIEPLWALPCGWG